MSAFQTRNILNNMLVLSNKLILALLLIPLFYPLFCRFCTCCVGEVWLYNLFK